MNIFLNHVVTQYKIYYIVKEHKKIISHGIINDSLMGLTPQKRIAQMFYSKEEDTVIYAIIDEMLAPKKAIEGLKEGFEIYLKSFRERLNEIE